MRVRDERVCVSVCVMSACTQNLLSLQISFYFTFYSTLTPPSFSTQLLNLSPFSFFFHLLLQFSSSPLFLISLFLSPPFTLPSNFHSSLFFFQFLFSYFYFNPSLFSLVLSFPATFSHILFLLNLLSHFLRQSVRTHCTRNTFCVSFHTVSFHFISFHRKQHKKCLVQGVRTDSRKKEKERY